MARRALRRAEAGAVVEILADDPLAKLDISHMCAEEEIDILAVGDEGGTLRMALRRRKPLA